jgi:hypothetical protein
MEIASGIHLLEGVMGADSNLVGGGRGFTLADAGLLGNAEKTVEYVKGLSPSGGIRRRGLQVRA